MTKDIMIDTPHFAKILITKPLLFDAVPIMTKNITIGTHNSVNTLIIKQINFQAVSIVTKKMHDCHASGKNPRHVHKMH